MKENSIESQETRVIRGALKKIEKGEGNRPSKVFLKNENGVHEVLVWEENEPILGEELGSVLEVVARERVKGHYLNLDFVDYEVKKKKKGSTKEEKETRSVARVSALLGEIHDRLVEYSEESRVKIALTLFINESKKGGVY